MTLQTFQESFYLTENPDVLAAVRAGVFTSAEQHYIMFGEGEGRQPNPVFEPAGYLIDNPDVFAAVQAGVFSSALQHFENYGVTEGRSPGVPFDEAYYLENNPDVSEAVAAGVFTSGYAHFVLFGADEGRNPAEGVSPGPGGETVQLTPEQDTLEGFVFEAPLFTSPLTGAQIQTLTTVDTLTGAGAEPTLNATLNGTEATTRPTMSGVQVLNLTSVPVPGVLAASVLDAANSTGITQVWSRESSADLDVRNLAEIPTVGMDNTVAGVDYTVRVANDVVSADADEVSIILNNVGQNDDVLTGQDLNVRGQTAGGFEVFNITTEGGASRLQSLGSDATRVAAAITNQSNLETINLAGTANLRVDNPLFGVTTFAAAEDFASNIRVGFADGDDDQDVTYTGGAGNDRVDMGDGLTADDSLNAGEGDNTLVVAGAGDEVFGATTLDVTGFQTLDIDNGGGGLVTGTYNLARLGADAMPDTLFVRNTTTPPAQAITIDNADADLAVNITGDDDGAGNVGTVDVGLSSAANTGGNTITVGLGRTDEDATADLTIANLILNGYEAITLSTEAAQTETTIGAGLDADDLEQLTIVGGEDLTIGGGTGTNTLTQVNAGDFTGDLVLTTQAGAGGGTGATAYTGVRIQSGSGDDDITAGVNLDRVDLGAGDDRYTSANAAGNGGDVITTGAGSDTIAFASSGDGGIVAGGRGTAATVDTDLGHRVTDFTGGTGGDVLEFSRDGFAAFTLTGTVAIDIGDDDAARAADDGDILVLSGRSFANYTAAEEAVELVNEDFNGVIVYRDAGEGAVKVVADADTGTPGGDALVTLQGLTTVEALGTLAAANFDVVA